MSIFNVNPVVLYELNWPLQWVPVYPLLTFPHCSRAGGTELVTTSAGLVLDTAWLPMCWALGIGTRTMSW